MVEPNLSAYIQNQIKQAQDIEAQIESIASQRYQLDVLIRELDKTIKELKSISEGTPVYKSVGPVMYLVEDKNKLINDLEEQKELSQMRSKTLENQQKSLEQKYREVQESLQKKYQEASKGEGN
ncbi:prefoldin subunit beta [Picrophilus oshimae]|uniref:Prefoldin subunit beta n=1 Tax=Picrophilus torridus (strain ATCC 700027 / DSM 9790 / JCM 10055 / NBRC 100828 / KAW 2/3) TaxID=1122961 RepID=Q6L0A9_PICTO|nr:prefoldin subunit beta [Picrophilus oshimae]AAT43593.1 hypothetical prefoldin beta subunit [Picrophilus oshimae DSM 9789]SMD31217.1 prefoldin beta subunit [Picrophilus oshimae DSM 9789]